MTGGESASAPLSDAGESHPRVLRLGLLCNSPSPHQVDLLNALGARPDVDVFVGYAFPGNPNRPWGRPVPSGLRWEVMPSGAAATLRNRIGHWLDAQQRDVWIITSNYTAVRTHLVARHLHRRGICWAYMAEPPIPTAWWKEPVRRLIVRSLLRRAHGLASTGAEALRRYEGLAPPGILTASVPYYQSLEMFHRLPLPAPPKAGEPFRFVSVSNLLPRKGLFCLLEACSRLPGTGWSLDIYGRGPLQAKLSRQIHRLGLPVKLCGIVPYAERPRMYQGYHCLVFSSLFDGWGMALPEALAAGLPVIATDMIMSAHEFVRNGENGFIGPASDPGFLATAMRHYLEHPDRLVAAGPSARASLSNYEPRTGAERVIQFASQLAQTTSRRIREGT